MVGPVESPSQDKVEPHLNGRERSAHRKGVVDSVAACLCNPALMSEACRINQKDRSRRSARSVQQQQEEFITSGDSRGQPGVDATSSHENCCLFIHALRADAAVGSDTQ